jgi:hypothetical protein
VYERHWGETVLDGVKYSSRYCCGCQAPRQGKTYHILLDLILSILDSASRIGLNVFEGGHRTLYLMIASRVAIMPDAPWEKITAFSHWNTRYGGSR